MTAPVIPLPVIYAKCCGERMRVVTECATCHEDRCALCIDDHECDDGAHGECACPECVERAADYYLAGDDFDV